MKLPLVRMLRTDYHWPMLRSGLSRSLSILLLLCAGSFEPVWELGHAVLHHEASHHAAEAGVGASEPGGAARVTVLSADQPGDHGHPVLQAPAKPRTELVLFVLALPASSPSLSSALVVESREAFLSAPARASPVLDLTAPTRAPPLA